MSRFSPLRQRQVREQRVEAVGHARVDVQLGRHAGVTEPHRVIDVLIGEPVDGAHRDQRGGQTGQIRRPGGRGIGGHLGAALGSAEVRAPPVVVRARRPDGVDPLARRGDLAVIDHRVDEQLERHADLRPIVGQEGQAGGEPRPGAGTADAEAGPVHAQVGRVVAEPAQPAVAVVERSGIGRFGRQPVLHRRAGTAELLAPVIEPSVVARGAAEHQPAAVHPVHARQRPLDAHRPVQPDDDAVGRLVVHAADPVRQLEGRQRCHGGSDLRQGLVGEAAEIEREVGEGRGRVGIEQGLDVEELGHDPSLTGPARRVRGGARCSASAGTPQRPSG